MSLQECTSFVPDPQGEHVADLCNSVVMRYGTARRKKVSKLDEGRATDKTRHDDDVDRENWVNAEARWRVFEVSLTQGWKTTKRWLDANGRDVTNAKDR